MAAVESDGEGWPSFLIVGLEGPAGIEAALALTEAGNCTVTLGDDMPATADWRTMASCLLLETRSSCHPDAATGLWDDYCDPPAPPATTTTTVAKMRRSQFLSAVLNNSVVIKKAGTTTNRVRALSPVGDASVVDGFEAVVMGGPTLPHAIAFNEHVGIQYSSIIVILIVAQS